MSRYTERMRRFSEASLYLVTSQRFSGERSTVDIIRSGLAAGIRLFQLREKDLTVAELVELAGIVRTLTAECNALLIINDRVDVALACDADGVHLGREDLPIDAARRIAPDLIIGASAHSVDEALEAERKGASYINIGPLFATVTKEWHGQFLGLDGLRDIRGAVSLPFTVMGGIKKEHVPALVVEGARIIAVVTAVTAAADPETAAREFIAEIVKAKRNL